MSRAVRLLKGLGFVYDGHFLVHDQEHAILKTVNQNREKWFYTIFSQSSFFAGLGEVKMIDLERLAGDPRLEEILFVHENGKIYSCTVQDLLFYSNDDTGSTAYCICFSRLKDARDYNDWSNPGGDYSV